MYSRSFSACTFPALALVLSGLLLPTSAIDREGSLLSVKAEILGPEQHKISWVDTEPTVVKWQVVVKDPHKYWSKNVTANEVIIDKTTFADFKDEDGAAWNGFVRQDPPLYFAYIVRGFTADGNVYPTEGMAFQSSVPSGLLVVSQSLSPTDVSIHAEHAPSSLACEEPQVGVTVRWTEPDDRGLGTRRQYRHAPLVRVLNYLVEISSSPDFAGEAAATVSTGVNTTVTVTGLTKGTVYYARVTPETRAGAGMVSSVTAGVEAREVPCDAAQVVLGGEVLPRPQYARCSTYATWEDFWYCHAGGLCPYKTGELENRLSEEGVVERWVCYNHPCAALGGGADERFCYVYHEKAKAFIAWGPHSELQLIQAADELR